MQKRIFQDNTRTITATALLDREQVLIVGFKDGSCNIIDLDKLTTPTYNLLKSQNNKSPITAISARSTYTKTWYETSYHTIVVIGTKGGSAFKFNVKHSKQDPTFTRPYTVKIDCPIHTAAILSEDEFAIGGPTKFCKYREDTCTGIITRKVTTSDSVPVAPIALLPVFSSTDCVIAFRDGDIAYLDAKNTKNNPLHRPQNIGQIKTMKGVVLTQKDNCLVVLNEQNDLYSVDWLSYITLLKSNVVAMDVTYDFVSRKYTLAFIGTDNLIYYGEANHPTPNFNPSDFRSIGMTTNTASVVNIEVGKKDIYVTTDNNISSYSIVQPSYSSITEPFVISNSNNIFLTGHKEISTIAIATAGNNEIMVVGFADGDCFIINLAMPAISKVNVFQNINTQNTSKITAISARQLMTHPNPVTIIVIENQLGYAYKFSLTCDNSGSLSLDNVQMRRPCDTPVTTVAILSHNEFVIGFNQQCYRYIDNSNDPNPDIIFDAHLAALVPINGSTDYIAAQINGRVVYYAKGITIKDLKSIIIPRGSQIKTIQGVAFGEQEIGLAVLTDRGHLSLYFINSNGTGQIELEKDSVTAIDVKVTANPQGTDQLLALTYLDNRGFSYNRINITSLKPNTPNSISASEIKCQGSIPATTTQIESGSQCIYALAQKQISFTQIPTNMNVFSRIVSSMSLSSSSTPQSNINPNPTQKYNKLSDVTFAPQSKGTEYTQFPAKTNIGKQEEEIIYAPLNNWTNPE